MIYRAIRANQRCKVVYVLPFQHPLVFALYCLVTVLFAVLFFLEVYFSYPTLDWLVCTIMTSQIQHSALCPFMSSRSSRQTIGVGAEPL